MRQLRVVGLGDDTTTVILEDPVRHERFTVASDERLRAAARGDIRRLGQMEIEVSSPLRPRDIQSRVRGGEAVEDVAATAGVSVSHVERFAYPVLLERARVAELAGRAHPLRDDRPDPRMLRDIAAATLAARGQSYDDARWDAWKGEDGRWTVALSWSAGRSENVAHWAFRPGPSGGLVEPRDDAARDLGGEPPSGPRRADGRSGRTPRPEVEQDTLDDAEDLELPARLVVNGSPAPTPPPTAPPAPPAPSGPPSSPAPSGGPSGAVGYAGAPTAPAAAPAAPAATPAETPGVAPESPYGTTRRPESPRPSHGAPDPRVRRPARGASRPGRGTPVVPPAPGTPTPPTPPTPAPSTSEAPSGPTPRDETPPDTAPSAPAEGPAPEPEGDDAERRRKRHPIVPSWEDVLLGVRSPKG